MVNLLARGLGRGGDYILYYRFRSYDDYWIHGNAERIKMNNRTNNCSYHWPYFVHHMQHMVRVMEDFTGNKESGVLLNNILEDL